MFFKSWRSLSAMGKAFFFSVAAFQLFLGLPTAYAGRHDIALVDSDLKTPTKRKLSLTSQKANKENIQAFANLDQPSFDETPAAKKKKNTKQPKKTSSKEKLQSLILPTDEPSENTSDISTLQTIGMAVDDKAEDAPKTLPFIKLTKEEKDTFIDEEWTELEILKFEYLNSLLYRADKYFTGDELKTYAESGGDIFALEEAMVSLNQHYPKAIVNPATMDKRLFSPSARLAKQLSRPQLTSLKARKVLFPVDPNYDKEPAPVETEEEKLAKKKALTLLFEQAEAKRGVTVNQKKSDLAWEINLWNTDYFPYMEKMREAAQTQTKSKIKRGDIEVAFQTFLAPSYKSFQYKGYTVYYNEELIDLKRQGPDKISNADRLKSSMCPIGPDGDSMNFHHLTHHDPGLIVILTNDFHEKYSGLLHFAHKIYHRPNAVDRRNFNDARNELCIKLFKILNP